MKAFEFNLERVLKLRAYREREWELKLAEATGACVRLRRSIEEANREKARELSERFRRGTDVRMLEVSSRYVERLEKRIEGDEAALETEEAKRAEIQEAFLDAQRERKVLEKLKERKAENYRREQRLEETAEIDDMNTERSSRSRTGGGIGG